MKKILVIFSVLAASAIHLPHVCAKDTARNNTAAPINDSHTSAGTRNTEKNMGNTGKNHTSPNTRIDYSGTRRKQNRNDPVRKGNTMRKR